MPPRQSVPGCYSAQRSAGTHLLVKFSVFWFVLRGMIEFLGISQKMLTFATTVVIVVFILVVSKG